MTKSLLHYAATAYVMDERDIIFDNIAMGITMGAALGLVFGAAFSQNNKKG